MLCHLIDNSKSMLLQMKISVVLLTLLTGTLATISFSCSKTDNGPAPVKDVESNSYNTIRIGNQVWMAENLRTATFNDGTAIPVVPDASEWSNLTTPGLCWYNNDELANRESYGTLYNYFTVTTGKLCPSGWHIPSGAELQTLRETLGDTLTGGGKLKEEGTVHWRSPNTGADNSTGFTALPAGIRYFEGTYSSLAYFTSFWSSTRSDDNKIWYLSLYYSDAVAAINKTSGKDGFSVRCIKD